MSKDHGDEAVEVLSVEGHEVRVTHPDKPYFSKQTKLSKLDLVRYYLAVAPGALVGIRDRPIVLKRFVNGAEGEAFYQKRAPSRSAGVDANRNALVSFRPHGGRDRRGRCGWTGLDRQLGCIELHPHPVRSADLDHPDELRVDLDPGPGVGWADVRRVALEVKALLEEMGLRGWPKTSGSRGMHVNVRIHPRWSFHRGASRGAGAVPRGGTPRCRAGQLRNGGRRSATACFSTTTRTPRIAPRARRIRCVRLPDARVSTPLSWDEVPDCDPADFTVLTVPKRFAEIGDPHADMDAAAGSLEELLELAARG